LCQLLLPLALCAVPVSNQAAALNDTGIMRCVDATTADPTTVNTLNAAVTAADAAKNTAFAALITAADKVNTDASLAASAAAAVKAAVATALASVTTAVTTTVITPPVAPATTPAVPTTTTAATLVSTADSASTLANNNANTIASLTKINPTTGTPAAIPSTVVFSNAVIEANFAATTAIQTAKDAAAENTKRITLANMDAAYANVLANSANINIANGLACTPVSNNLSAVATQVNAAATKATLSAAAAKSAAATALTSATTAKTTADIATNGGVSMTSPSTSQSVTRAQTLFNTASSAVSAANANAVTIATQTSSGAAIPSIIYPTAISDANAFQADAVEAVKAAIMVNAEKATKANTDAATTNALANTAIVSLIRNKPLTISCTTTGTPPVTSCVLPQEIVVAKGAIEATATSAANAANVTDFATVGSDSLAFTTANLAADAAVKVAFAAKTNPTEYSVVSSSADTTKQSAAAAALSAKATTAAAIAAIDAIAAANAAAQAATDAAAVSASIDAYTSARTATATCTLGTFPSEVFAAKSAIEGLASAIASAASSLTTISDASAFNLANQAANTVMTVSVAQKKFPVEYTPVLTVVDTTKTDTAKVALSTKAATAAALASADTDKAVTLATTAAKAAATVATSISAYNLAKKTYDDAVTAYDKASAAANPVTDPALLAAQAVAIAAAKAAADAAKCLAVSSDAGAYPRQDGRYGRDADVTANMVSKIGAGRAGFDFTRITNDGTLVTATLPAPPAVPPVVPDPLGPDVVGSNPGNWACTKDNVTGLVWEMKTTTAPRNMGLTYSWYNSSATTNGGAMGVANGGNCSIGGLPASTRCDTEKYVADVNAAGLCGFTDWRLPTVKELESIVDFSGTNTAAVDPNYFPNTNFTVNTWTASPLANYSSYAWAVNFKEGNTVIAPRDSKYAVRLVRGGQ
jgi:hypothetical protein